MQAENVEFQWNQTVESVIESIVADDVMMVGRDGVSVEEEIMCR